MPSKLPAIRGQAFTWPVELTSQAQGNTFQVNPTIVTGDVKVIIDGGAPADITSLPEVDVDFTKRVVVSLSAAEMDGDLIEVVFSDQSEAEWKDLSLKIPTAAYSWDGLPQAIWDTLTSALTSAGTIGKLLVDNINATIGSRSSHAAADVWSVATRVLSANTNLNDPTAAAIRAEMDTNSAKLDVAVSTRNAVAPDNAGIAEIQAKTDNLPASPAATGDIPTAGDNADAVWNEPVAEHDAAGSFGEDTQAHALTTDVAGLATAAALTTVGGNVDAIKAVTDAIPDEGALTDLLAAVAAILAATGTGGVVISAATRQAIADEILKRGVVNTEDTAEAASLTELILAALEAGRVGTTMTVRKTDGTTFSTKTLTLDDTAEKVTGIT